MDEKKLKALPAELAKGNAYSKSEFFNNATPHNYSTLLNSLSNIINCKARLLLLEILFI